MKKDLLITTIVILSILAVIAGFVGFCFWLFGGKLSITGLNLSSSEITFLTSNGFLESEDANINSSYLKPFDLIEQNLNSDNESFKVLATKLNNNKYQMAFKLENKSEQDKDFYLIPVSKDSQLQFEEVRGVIDNKNTIAINKENTIEEPLEQLYDVEKHKKELNPELAKAYEDIKGNGYSAKPIKITLPPKSTLLAQSDWRVGPSNGSADSAVGLEPVYLLVYGSAGGAKDDLVIINVQSHPQQGENWEVSFTTNGKADLKIIPNDQATIDDDEFVSLFCDNEERTPQILQGDVIYYSNWECLGTGKVIHYTKKAGTHILRFEFNGQTAFAYNGGACATSKWQKNWRVYYDDGAEPVTPYADENTGATLSSNSAIVRIRVALTVGCGLTLTNLKIQYSTDDTNFTDMGADNAWNWANGQGTDGGTVTTFKLSDTSTKKIYVESSQSPALWQDSSNELDFAIAPTATVSASTLYYFRFYYSSTALFLFTGKTHPQITTAAASAPETPNPLNVGGGLNINGGFIIKGN